VVFSVLPLANTPCTDLHRYSLNLGEPTSQVSVRWSSGMLEWF
jgi:hypothetical protein